MAVPIVNIEPAAVCFSRNEIPLKITSGNYETATGAKAKDGLVFTGDPIEDNLVDLTWNGETIRLYFKDSPDDSGRQVPTNSASDPLSTYLSNLADAFRDVYEINRDFIVTSTSSELRLEAREVGAKYEITIAETINNCTTPIATPVTGTDRTVEANFHYMLDIYVEDVYDSGNYVKLPTIVHAVDDNGVAEFDLSSYLHTYLASYPPGYAFAALEVADTINKRYYYEYSEFFGDPGVHKKVYTSSTKRVILGGVNTTQFAGLSGDVVANLFKPGLAWLNKRGDYRRVTLGQHDALYFFLPDYSTESIAGDFDALAQSLPGENNVSIDLPVELHNNVPAWIQVGGWVNLEFTYNSTPYDLDYVVKGITADAIIVDATFSADEDNLANLSNGDDVTIKFVINGTTRIKYQRYAYFDDGTEQGWENIENTTYDWEETLAFPAGPTETGVAAMDPAKTLVKYKLRLLVDVTTVGREITYYIEPADWLDKVFLYQNSQGGWDYLRTYGDEQGKWEVEKQTIAKPLPFQASASDVMVVDKPTTHQIGGRVRTGNISKSEYQDLLELVIGQEILWWDTENAQYVPVRIPKKNYKLNPVDETLYNLEFEYYLAKREVNR